MHDQVAHDPEFLANAVGTGADAQLVRRVMEHQMGKQTQEQEGTEDEDGKPKVKVRRVRVRKRLPGGKGGPSVRTEVILTNEAKADIARRTKILTTQGLLPSATRTSCFITVCAFRAKLGGLALEASQQRQENLWALLYRENPSLFRGHYGQPTNGSS